MGWWHTFGLLSLVPASGCRAGCSVDSKLRHMVLPRYAHHIRHEIWMACCGVQGGEAFFRAMSLSHFLLSGAC